MPDTVLDRLSVEKRTVFWRQVIEQAGKQFVFVATDDQGSVVGFVNGGRERDAFCTAKRYAL